jgi:uncharacterized membrane protein (UPF0127 family)
MMMADLRKSDGTAAATDVEMADTVLKKTVGVMFRRSLPSGFAMIFDMGREMRGNIAIHMVFVFVSIDVIYLDGKRTIVDIKHGLRPWIGLAVPKKAARYAIEMPAGAAAEQGLKEGDLLEW